MNGIRETNEASMIAAHKAGAAYWKRNRPDINRAQIESLARSCGFHGEDAVAYVAGFIGEKNRSEVR